MNTELQINAIPSVIWGKKSNKVFIAIHGAMSHKKDTVIRLLAEVAEEKGYQTISFDLPQSGERTDANYLCNPQNCVKDLTAILNFAQQNYRQINLFACSMGAYFSLLAYKNQNLIQTLFLSPIVNMQALIENMMLWSNTTKQQLQAKRVVPTNFGQTLYWDYYQYVVQNPIDFCLDNTSILYGTKDNMQNCDMINQFARNHNCNLTVMENGEHYFHTDSQLDFFKIWLAQNIK